MRPCTYIHPKIVQRYVPRSIAVSAKAPLVKCTLQEVRKWRIKNPWIDFNADGLKSIHGLNAFPACGGYITIVAYV